MRAGQAGTALGLGGLVAPVTVRVLLSAKGRAWIELMSGLDG